MALLASYDAAGAANRRDAFFERCFKEAMGELVDADDSMDKATLGGPFFLGMYEWWVTFDAADKMGTFDEAAREYRIHYVGIVSNHCTPPALLHCACCSHAL